jgi:hypothetical protein
MAECATCASGDSAATLNEPDETSLNHGLGDDDQVPQSDAQIDQELQFAKTERHLQNDDVFQTPIVPGEVPDLKEDVKLIAADENALEDLQYLIADIRRTRGMCQSFAMEAERIAPGVMGVPLGYFTKSITTTRYRIATENLFAKVWEFIKQAIAKLREAMRKVIFWIIGKKDGKASKDELKRENAEATQRADETAKQAEKATDEVSAAAVNLSNAVKHGATFKEGSGTTQLSDLDRIIGELIGGQNEHVRKYMGGTDPVFNDLVNQGSYYKLLVNTNKAVLPAISAMQEKVMILAKTLDALVAGDSSTSEALQGDTLKKLQSETLFRTDGQERSLSAYLEHMRATQSDASKPAQQMRSFDEVFSSLSQAFRTRLIYELNRFVDAGTSILIDAEDALREVEEKLAKPAAQDHTAQTNVDWHATIHTLRTDMTDLTAIIMHVKSYRTQVTTMVMDAMGFAYEVAEAVQKQLAPDQPSHQVTSAIEDLIKEAAHYRQELAKLQRI